MWLHVVIFQGWIQYQNMVRITSNHILVQHKNRLDMELLSYPLLLLDGLGWDRRLTPSKTCVSKANIAKSRKGDMQQCETLADFLSIQEKCLCTRVVANEPIPKRY